MMKKGSIILFIIFLAALLMISGCGNQNTTEKESEDKISTEIPGNFTVAGGSVGGVWSVFTEGVSEAVRREFPGTLIAAEPGSVAGNPISVGQNKINFAISESLTALFAYEGSTPFDKKHEDIRAVAAIIPDNVFQMVAPLSAEFDSIEDIVNNKVGLRYSAGEKDALGDVISSAIFESYEVTYDDIESYGGKVDFLSGGKTFELMADKRIDGLGKMVPIPAGDILEASAAMDMKLIPIGDKAIDHLVKKFGMIPYTIKAGSYSFQSKDYPTVKSPTILITNANVSDEVVYKVTKAIYNQLDYLYDVHNGFKAVNDETIVQVGKIPLHPGAEKFYKEIGLIKN